MNTKITMMMVESIDGITSRQDGKSVKSWSSKEDGLLLQKEIRNSDVLIMGRRSFKQSFTNLTKAPIYVLTTDFNLLNNSTKQVIFTNKEPTELIHELKQRKFKNILLLGGQVTNTNFLLQGLVDNVKLTIEPKMFGTGLPLMSYSKTNIKLKLTNIEQLNSQGTIRLCYKITNNKELKRAYAQSMRQTRSSGTKLSTILNINKMWWNERAKKHYKSKYYDIKKFLSGKNRIFEFEEHEVGNVSGKKLLHLQCHIGTETLSWARLGADVTGVDFSEQALDCATDLAKRANLQARFIHSNIYDVLDKLNGEKFDIIYVNYGSIRWLDDIEEWARIISVLLKKNGFLYMHESHPISMALSSDTPIFIRDYFYNQAQQWVEQGSYTDGCENTKHNIEFGWERPLGETISAISKAGLFIEFLHERKGHIDKQFSYLEQATDGFWYPTHGIPPIPATFTLKAIKK